ncbi:hypothetical protein C8F04DRAFT_259065 [Mycena alexandri]|uniref:NACHT domain-containing protein n=1 Tax=Mycena alexandri TaxID=1745969 RepID=A0AAD6SA91_9AGAR|nr:hypothetical protein C8F04DRAFT_259065 [Mycena alexandri]
MPLFTSSSGVQINGGNFIDIAGDINIQSARPILGRDSALAEMFSSAGRDSLGPDRTIPQARAAKRLPYDVSRRQQIPHRSTIPGDQHGESISILQMHLPPVVDPSIQGGNPSARIDYPPGRKPPSSTNYSPPESRGLTTHAHLLAWERHYHEPHTNITGGTFIGGNVNHVQRHGETGLHILHCVSAGDALHDSAERYPQPICHPETRQEILQDLWNWSSETDPSSSVLWLHGPAGSGKSAIAQSLCQKLEQNGRLGGCFFFKRGNSARGNAKRLFPTIAYQLALLKDSHLKDVVCQKVEDNPSILDRSLSSQLQELIVEPCRQSLRGRTLVIVIDGLDECDGHEVQQEVLRALGSIADGQPLPLRFLVASRPEPHIGDMFRAPCLARLHRPFNIEQAFEDVRIYLLDEFSRIRVEHRQTMATISGPWPSSDVIQELIHKSSGYFIYASTVIKFIDDKQFRPTERLDIIMGLIQPEFGSPFAALDQLYTEILSSVQPRHQLIPILTLIAAGFSLRVAHIEQLLELKPGDLRLTLHGLHSVILVPEEPETNMDLTVHHVSFRDFLGDPARSGAFYVGDPWHRADLARKILKAFSYTIDDSWNGAHVRSHITRRLGESALRYIPSVVPSPELVAFLKSLNPDFLFSILRFMKPFSTQPVDMILDWLKRIRPLPEPTIRLWEDYRFMILCDHIWSDVESHPSKFLRAGSQIPSENFSSTISPNLLRILHTCAFFGGHDQAVNPDRTQNTTPLSNVRTLLDFTWDEMRGTICPLRTIIGEDEGTLGHLLISATRPTIFRTLDFTSTLGTAIRNYMTAITKIDSGKPDRWFSGESTVKISRLWRAHPPCPDLLREIRAIWPDSNHSFMGGEDFHNLIEWLNAFPRPPAELVEGLRSTIDSRYGFLPSMTASYFEENWQQWTAHELRIGYFHSNPISRVPNRAL